jgi:pimeloyl-ACP methyl ester carboxylesterase
MPAHGARSRRSRYSQITASMAPLWIAISKTLAASPVKFSSEPARIRCPVDEIGRNSVSPSTTPMTAALRRGLSATGGPRLHGLWLPQPVPDAPVLLFLHGVRWDVRASAPRMRQLHALGFSVLGIDYRGFGRSSAALPSETLVAEDTRAAWDWLAREQPHARRYVFGHSLGGVIGVRLAHEVTDEAGLIVEGGFTSTQDLVNSTRWGWLPIERLITQHFDAGSRIAGVGSPVLVVHGSLDTMVAPALGRALYERALPPKRFLLVEGAVHEDTDVVGHKQYRVALRELFGLGSAR